MNEILCRQLAADYGCTAAEVKDSRNHFTVFSPREGRRRWGEDGDCFLKAAAVGGKLLFTGQEDILAECEAVYGYEPGEWFMDGPTLCGLNERLRPYGYRVGTAHPFFIAERKTDIKAPSYDICWHRGGEIERFRGDRRFVRALSFDTNAPDEIAVTAERDGQILGMAGASADSGSMWQIGIDVEPAFRDEGIASVLVTLLKNALLDQGILPFYGTAMSHIASQKTALNAGFRPAWAELVTKKII